MRFADDDSNVLYILEILPTVMQLNLLDDILSVGNKIFVSALASIVSIAW